MVPAYASTVEENKKLFTQRELKEIETAVKFRSAMGNKPIPEILKIMSSMADCPVSASAVLNSVKLYGTDLSRLRGASTKQKSAPLSLKTLIIYYPVIRHCPLISCTSTGKRFSSQSPRLSV
jgi:hypothetical protein